MKKIIKTKEVVKPRVTAEPFFDILNTYFKELLSGNKPEHTKAVKEALEAWTDLDCQGQECDECLYFKYQGWIETIDTNAADLCDVISKLLVSDLKKNRYIDLMNVPGLRLSGSAYSRK